MENKKAYREQEPRFRGQKIWKKKQQMHANQKWIWHTAKRNRGNTRQVKPNSAIHEEETKTMM